ncbi:MAG: hypothetical protein B7C24_07375 [Bacteroidetes bacterium 4572_77]|nr:MAG: hypothetical protein B7C24_07375 [Bacteroidetes bacterium 4572_77]
MKNRLLVLLILSLGFVVSAFSQKEFRYYEYQGLGLKAGANFSTVMLQPSYTEVIGQMDWEAGLVYVFSHNKFVGVQIEALYVNRTWKESFEEYSATNQISYVQLPLLTNIIIGNGRLKFTINLGSYYAIKIGEEQNIDFPLDHPYYEKITSRQVQDSDYGLLIGGGVRYISDIGIFQLEARYAYGFKKLYTPSITGFETSNWSSTQVGLVYFLSLGK